MRSSDRPKAADWRAHAYRPWKWRRCHQQAGASSDYRPGEAGGFFVECDEFPDRRAYLKPVKRDRLQYRAAREKIAADLAYDIDLCVPPVLLATRQDAPDNEERNVCVSLVLYPRQWSWKQLRPVLFDPDSQQAIAPIAEKALPSQAAYALAFDTWVGQYDHKDHPHNIVFGYDPKNPETENSFIFLDFSFSMGLDGRWDNGNYKEVKIAGFPELMLKNLSTNDLSSAVSKIEGLADARINDTVTRVPETHISEEDADLISNALCYRKHGLRDALKGMLP